MRTQAHKNLQQLPAGIVSFPAECVFKIMCRLVSPIILDKRQLILQPDNNAFLGSRTSPHSYLSHSTIISLDFIVRCNSESYPLYCWKKDNIYPSVWRKTASFTLLYVSQEMWTWGKKKHTYYTLRGSQFFFLYKLPYSALIRVSLFLVSISTVNLCSPSHSSALKTAVPHFTAANPSLSTSATALWTLIQCIKMGIFPRTSLGTGTRSDTICRDEFLISLG